MGGYTLRRAGEDQDSGTTQETLNGSWIVKQAGGFAAPRFSPSVAATVIFGAPAGVDDATTALMVIVARPLNAGQSKSATLAADAALASSAAWVAPGRRDIDDAGRDAGRRIGRLLTRHIGEAGAEGGQERVLGGGGAVAACQGERADKQG